MHALTKTYVSIGLVLLAGFLFYSAMRIFGVKGGAGPMTKTLMRLHRVFGYVWGVYFVWISWICVDLMERLFAAGGYELDPRGFGHGTLAVVLFLIFLLKISFIRQFDKYRPYVPLLGIILAVGTVTLWLIAGWWYLIITAYGKPGII